MPIATQNHLTKRFSHSASLKIDARITTRAPIRYVPFHELEFTSSETIFHLEKSKLRSEFTHAHLNGEALAIRALECSPSNHDACVRNWRAIHHLSNFLIRSHPGIIKLMGISQTPEAGKLLILMERAHHGSLEEYLASFAGTEQDGDFLGRARMLAEISDTMSYLHDVVGVAHRDLKASNVLVARDGTARLADFETVIALDPVRKRLLPSAGSLLHKAPELLSPVPSYDGEELCEYNSRVDVWSFGVLLHEVMHPRETPYSEVFSTSPGLSPMTVTEFSRSVACGETELRWDGGSTSEYERLASVGKACMQLVPEDRPSFSEVSVMLKRILDERGAQVGGGWRMHQLPLAPPEITMAAASCQTRHRDSMEDFSSIIEGQEFSLCGVFDGHNGSGSAAWANVELTLRLCRVFARRNNGAEEENTRIAEAFALTDNSIRLLDLCSGTTAVVVVARPSEVVTVWCGDSLAQLYRANRNGAAECVSLVEPHKPEREDEAARLRRAGARVGRETTTLDSGETMPVGPYRVAIPGEESKGYFSLSRALGDHHAKSLLISQPEVSRVARGGGGSEGRRNVRPSVSRDLFLVAGTDGFFDWVDARETLEEVFEGGGKTPPLGDLESLSRRLVKRAVTKGASDNVSLVVMRL